MSYRVKKYKYVNQFLIKSLILRSQFTPSLGNNCDDFTDFFMKIERSNEKHIGNWNQKFQKESRIY